MLLRFCDDRELLARWAEGDAGAGDELVRRHRAAVLRFAARVYHLDRESSEEVAQITFERLQGAIRTFQGRCSVATFVRSIANHACLDLHRGRAETRRRVEVTLDDASDLDNSASDPASHVVFSADLERCLGHLTERSRALFLARATEGRSYEELAARFDMSCGAVGRVICEARRALAKCLEG